METSNEIYQHIIDDLSQNISESGKLKLSKWLEEKPVHQLEYNAIKSIWKSDTASNTDEKLWSEFNQKKKQSNTCVQRLWIRAALVASVIILFASGWMVNMFSISELTLATNNESFLKDTLDDGSQVFLYPSSTFVWNKTNNNVQLNGEAFFVIPPTQGKDYIINLGSAIIKVKGTSFRVSAVENSDKISVRVESGSVELYSTKNQEERLLVSAGEEGYYSNIKHTLWKGYKKESIYMIYKPNL